MPSLRPISLAGRGPNWEGFERELHLGLMIYILICQLNINCRSILENNIILHYFNLFSRPSQITLACKGSFLPSQSCCQNSFLSLRDGCRAYPNVLRISYFCYPTVTPSERTSPAVLATGLYRFFLYIGFFDIQVVYDISSFNSSFRYKGPFVKKIQWPVRILKHKLAKINFVAFCVVSRAGFQWSITV